MKTIREGNEASNMKTIREGNGMSKSGSLGISVVRAIVLGSRCRVLDSHSDHNSFPSFVMCRF